MYIWRYTLSTFTATQTIIQGVEEDGGCKRIRLFLDDVQFYQSGLSRWFPW